MDVVGVASNADFFNSWLLFLIPLAVSFVVLFLPGLASGYALGLRGRWLWGWAPVGSVGIVVAAAVIASKSGFTWGFSVLLIFCIFATFICWLLSFLYTRFYKSKNIETGISSFPKVDRSSRKWAYLPPILLLSMFVYETARFATAVKRPGAFAQIWDNVFHSNVVMMFLQRGDASPFKVDLWDPGRAGFYPAAWHQVVALVASTCSGAVTTATNAVALIVAFIIWPLGIFCLSSAIFASRLVQVISLAFSLALPQFPFALFSWGPLYPNLLSSSLLPMVIALFVKCLSGGFPALVPGLLATAWGLVSVGASQPNNVFTFVIVAMIVIWCFGVSRISHDSERYRGRKGVRSALLAGWTALCLAVYCLWEWGTFQISLIRGLRTKTPDWFPQGSYWSGIKQILSLTGGKPNADFMVYQCLNMLPLSALLIIGLLVLVISRKKTWLVFCWLVFSSLTLVGHSLQNLQLRQYFVGVWYADSPRLFVPVVMFSIPIAAAGLGWLIYQLKKWISPKVTRKTEAIILSVCLVLPVGITVDPTRLKNSWYWIGDVFSIRSPTDKTLGLVDEDELDLLLELPRLTPPNSVILGNPWEGAAFAWSLGQRRTIFPTLRYASTPMPDRAFLANKLYQPEQRKQVCSFLGTKNIYVLDFRNHYSGAEGKTGIQKRYPSFDSTNTPLLVPVKSVGEAHLLKYLGCLGENPSGRPDPR